MDIKSGNFDQFQLTLNEGTIHDMAREPEEDVYGVIKHADTMVEEIVIVKSKAIAHFIENDGMSEEEAEEHWSYNIAGAYGDASYSCVDDTICPDMLEEMLTMDEDGELCNPPYTGRKSYKGTQSRKYGEVNHRGKLLNIIQNAQITDTEKLRLMMLYVKNNMS